MSKINWAKPPFNHKGRWHKTMPSVMNPNAKVTLPQYIMESVIKHRTEFMPKYKNLQHGHGWSRPIGREVGQMCQQASVICNYFPHPEDDEFTLQAILNFLKKFKPLKLGQYRKNRFVEKLTGIKIIVTEAEKTVIKGIMDERDSLIERDNRKTVQVQPSEPKETPQYRTHNPDSSKSRKHGFRQISQMEKNG